MLSVLLISIFVCLAATQNNSPPAGVTAKQDLRTTWTSGSDTYYLYDITLTNGGTSTLPACGLLYLINFDADGSGSNAQPNENIRISQTWNVVNYATAGGPPHSEFGPVPSTSLSPGQSDNSAGYVVVNSETTLTLIYDDTCESSSSSTDSAGSTSSQQSSGSGSCNTLSLSQSLINSWDSGSQWTVTMTNRGTAAITILDLVVAESARISQIWGVTSSGSGHYTFPSYTTSIAAGETFSFGYISTDVHLVSFSNNGCSSSSTEASSSDSSNSAESHSSASASSSDSSSSACDASADSPGTFESLNKWSDGTYNYIQYTLSVTNKGTSPLASATAFIYYSSSYGSITQPYNFNVDSVEAGGATVTINTFNLSPGQTFNGAGYVFKYLISNENDPQYSHSHYTLPYAIRDVSAQC